MNVEELKLSLLAAKRNCAEKLVILKKFVNSQFENILSLYNEHAWLRLSLLLLIPPALFQLIFISMDMGKVPIIPMITCGGRYLVSESSAGVFDRRMYEGDCINDITFDMKEIVSESFILGLRFINNILEHQVCFETKSTIDNSDYISDSLPLKTVILEDIYARPRSLRLEYRPMYGTDVLANECKTIPPSMIGELTTKNIPFHTLDRRLLNELVENKVLTAVPNENGIYENRLFIEDSEVYARPKHILIFLYLFLVLSWMAALLTAIQLYKHFSDIGGTKKQKRS